MRYFKLNPEVPGGFGRGTILDRTTHPPKVSNLHYVFDGWLGDDLLTTFPVYLVSERLRESLDTLCPSGCEWSTFKMTKSATFMELHFERQLPHFWWLRIVGRAGVDDFGMSADHSLVVSERVLDCMKRFSLKHCDIAEYSVSELR